MKVGELIDTLSTMNPEADVLVVLDKADLDIIRLEEGTGPENAPLCWIVTTDVNEGDFLKETISKTDQTED